MLEIKNLTVEVGNRRVLRDVSLEVPSGATCVLFGPNGSGKSSLLNAIMGLSNYKVVEGQIIFDGRDITTLPVHERAQLGIGLMSQRPPNLVGVQLKDMLRVTAKGKKDPQELAGRLDMGRFLERDVNVGFSGGRSNAPSCWLAAQNPCLYLLDEPESGLTCRASRVRTMIHDLITGGITCAGKRAMEGKSALVITHRTDT